MADITAVWQRGGADVEVLPDPFPSARAAGAVACRPVRNRSGRDGAGGAGIYPPLARCLLGYPSVAHRHCATRPGAEPLDDPAMLLLSERATASPGAAAGFKDEPVETVQARSPDSRRLHRHRGSPIAAAIGHDPRAIGRAMVANVKAGGVRQGGSTLTQQLAKTSFLSSDRSLKRKAQECVIAFWVEGWLTKARSSPRYLSRRLFR